jgi:hypothetical protein
MNVASPRSVTRRKRHVAHNLDRFGPARCVIPYVLYAAWLWIDWVRLQDDAI